MVNALSFQLFFLFLFELICFQVFPSYILVIQQFDRAFIFILESNLSISKFYHHSFLQFNNATKVCFSFLFSTNVFQSFAIVHFCNSIVQQKFASFSCFQPMCFKAFPLCIFAIQQCNRGFSLSCLLFVSFQVVPLFILEV